MTGPATAGAPLSERPGAGDLAPYYRRYVDLVPAGDLFRTLRQQGADTAALLRRTPPECAGDRYAPDKWTVAEVAGHLIDTERVFGVRALRLARGDRTPLPGFDQDAFVAALPAGRPLADLAGEFERLRASTVDLFQALPPDALDHVGTVSGGPMSARGAAWTIAGHERHHVGILRDRYGLG